MMLNIYPLSKNPEYRNFEALDFVYSEFNTAIRTVGVHNAKIPRIELMAHAEERSLPLHDVEVAVTILLLTNHLVEKDQVLNSKLHAVYQPLPSQQKSPRPMPVNAERVRCYQIVKEVIGQRTTTGPKAASAHSEPPTAQILPTKTADPFARYDELTTAVANSTQPFFVTNLRLWLAMLDSTPVFARPILQRLESSANFENWFEPYRRLMMGIGGIESRIEWPTEREKRLGTQMLLFRKFTNGGIEPEGFAFLVLRAGSNINVGIRQISEQMFKPFSRELRSYLNEVIDQQTPAGWAVPASDTKIAAAVATDETDRTAPAADRFVTFDHNSAAFKEADSSLEQLAEAVRGSNELFANPDDRIAVAVEVSSIRTLIGGASVRIAAVQLAIAENGIIQWLAREAASGAVRAAATLAVGALIALIATIVNVLLH
jgi:hypothetical protein